MPQSLSARIRGAHAELEGLCAALVATPSENPPGDTTRIAEVVDAYLGKRGIPTKVYEPRKRMPNVDRKSVV